MPLYRYCYVCRGVKDSDCPFIRCKSCTQPHHFSCAGMKDFQAFENNDILKGVIRKDWTCEECVVGGEGQEGASSKKKAKKEKRSAAEIEEDKLLNEKFNKCKSEATRLGNNRKHFLLENYELIVPFCPAQSISRLSAKSHKPLMTNVKLQKTPNYIKAGLRDYQLHGVNEMLSWYSRGVGGILADEMGLGKTIQTISLIASLKEKLGVAGPHLIIAPLAVLQNWANELNRFCPTIRFRKIYGSIKEREMVLSLPEVQRGLFDVYLTTYETVIVEEAFFSDSWHWATVTIDEGHRIKNENAVLRAALNRIRSPFRLLLTGTPLQNNLHELWALLNYIMPDVFTDSSIFDEGAAVADDNLNVSTVKKARALLENTMMIRRVKRDVESSLKPKLQCKIYVPMTPIQASWYRSIIEKDYGKLELLSKNRLAHLFSQLVKVVNHPKQIYNRMASERDAEKKRISSNYYEGCEFHQEKSHLREHERDADAWKLENDLAKLSGESLVQASGKLAMLDRLLIRLKKQGSRVLLFSQYTETLDVLEEYVSFRFGKAEKAYLRLDGSTNLMVREIGVRAFNAPDSQVFIYLISTRAGGVGLNLATADSVVLYDSSWNPQVDLQAQDRAHRIGQRRQVTVYRLVTKDTLEEKIIMVAERKMILDQALIARDIIIDSRHKEEKDDEAQEPGTVSMTSLVSFGASKIMNCSSAESGVTKSAEELDREIDLFVEKAMSSSDVARSDGDDMFEAVHRQPVNTVICARKSKDDEVFTPCIIVEHGESQVRVCWVTAGKEDDEYEWLPRDAALLREFGTEDGEMLREIEEKRLQEDFKVHEKRRLVDDEPERESTRGDEPSSRANAPLRYICSHHVHPLQPTSGSVGLARCGVCNEEGASRFTCKAVLCHWHICASCSKAEPLLADKFLPRDHVDFIVQNASIVVSDDDPNKFAAAIAGVVKEAHADGTYDIEYVADSGDRILEERVPTSRLSSHRSSSDGRKVRHRKAPRRYEPIMPEKKITKARSSESECFLCKDGGELLECGQCPKVYHLECVGLRKVPSGSWSCPWHACVECDRKSSMTGGMQFRCLTCPEAYCFDCFPKDREMKRLDPPQGFVRSYESFGFNLPAKVVWCLCNRCSEEDRLRLQEREREAAQRREAAMKRVEESRNQQYVELYRAQQYAELRGQQESQSVVQKSYALVQNAQWQQKHRDIMMRQFQMQGGGVISTSIPASLERQTLAQSTESQQRLAQQQYMQQQYMHRQPMYIQQQLMRQQQQQPQAVGQYHARTHECLRVYPSAAAAANFMAISPAGINHCLAGNQTEYYGCRWQYTQAQPTVISTSSTDPASRANIERTLRVVDSLQLPQPPVPAPCSSAPPVAVAAPPVAVAAPQLGSSTLTAISLIDSDEDR